MSFLNPVSEPVLRFSSTDADAPQINYSSRTAGDIKAVLKACLVDGYGTTASAGWSVVNEVGEVAEFVSPSASMSDYRLGINDSSASASTWYYTYFDSRINPNYGASPSKSFSYTDNIKNKWELLVTDNGLFFIEILHHTASQKATSRVTWLGQLKPALMTNGINMSYFCLGYGADIAIVSQFFTTSRLQSNRLSNYDHNNTLFGASNVKYFETELTPYGINTAELASELFITTNVGVVLAQQPGLLLHSVNKESDAFGVYDDIIDGRPVFSIPLGFSNGPERNVALRTKRICIYTDQWGY